MLGPIALATAAYAAALAFVQTDLRRVVAWIATSQSALVLVGLDCPHGAGLTGAVVMWLSAGTAMTGLGLTAWMLEARFGPLRVDRHQGLYRRVPALGWCSCSLVSAWSRFPERSVSRATICFSPPCWTRFRKPGLLLFLATALNGFTVLRTYMRLFHGSPAAGRSSGCSGASAPRCWFRFRW